jgi:uncharacterized protein
MDTDLMALHALAVRAHPGMLAFWEASAQQRLLLPHCDACGRAHWYPRPFCPLCFNDTVRWQPALGTGRIHAATTLRRETPLRIVAYIELDEGVFLLSNVIGCTLAQARIGERVTVDFQPLANGRVLPVFRLTA